MSNNISMRDLLAAGAHFGHRTRFRNPKMSEYIFGSKNKIHIINLEKTLPLLTEACNYIGKLAKNHAQILFVGTKRAARDSISEHAKRCGMPYVDHRWLGGMLTNYKTVRQSVFRLKELRKMQEEGAFDTMIKKEALMLTRELEKLETSLGGIAEMNSLPDALFVIDVGFEHIAVEEANKLKIPVIGVVDTNHSPDNINYIIPGNDDSMRAIEIYTKAIADAIIDAQVIKGMHNKNEFVELSEDTVKKSKSAASKKDKKATPTATIIEKKSSKKDKDEVSNLEDPTPETNINADKENDTKLKSKTKAQD